MWRRATADGPGQGGVVGLVMGGGLGLRHGQGAVPLRSGRPPQSPTASNRRHPERFDRLDGGGRHEPAAMGPLDGPMG